MKKLFFVVLIQAVVWPALAQTTTQAKKKVTDNTSSLVDPSGDPAVKGYKLNFQVKGWKDTTVYLGYYLTDQTYLRDTARVNSAGFFSFDNKTALPQGVYFIVLNNSKIFDLVVGADQTFAIGTSSPDYFQNVTVKGDEDNKIFFENIAFDQTLRKEAEPFMKIMRDSSSSEDRKKSARESFGNVRNRAMTYQAELIKKYPTTVTARLLNAARPIEVPAPPKKANGQIDSAFQFRYYREHFFDHFNLADEVLLRLPAQLYKAKIKEYLEKLHAPVPDTIMMAIDKMAAVAKKNPETYKFLILNCMFSYQNPEVMGLDEVYVRVVDKYFMSGEMDFWATTSIKKELKSFADKLRGSLVGKTGANLIMQDQNFQPQSMYEIKNKYTILWIYDPDCGHCKEETPKLVEFYKANKKRLDVEVYSVASDTSMQKMRDFIKTMKMEEWINVNGPRSYLPEHYSKLYYAEQTPSLYILDRSHKIIAKKLPVKQLEDFFIKHEKFVQSQSKKNPPNKGT